MTLQHTVYYDGLFGKNFTVYGGSKMIKQHLDKKTGRIHNLLLRSHEEKMIDFVYGETKMIEIEQNYKITLTEEQARQLYNFLSDQKKYGQITPDTEITLIYHELKKLFDTGIR